MPENQDVKFNCKETRKKYWPQIFSRHEGTRNAEISLSFYLSETHIITPFKQTSILIDQDPTNCELVNGNFLN